MKRLLSHYFIITHPSSGSYMPEMKTGYSQWEPTLDEEANRPPRLFLSKRGASNAIRAWSKGCWVSRRDEPPTPAGGAIKRRVEDLVVVPVRFTPLGRM